MGEDQSCKCCVPASNYIETDILQHKPAQQDDIYKSDSENSVADSDDDSDASASVKSLDWD